MRQTSEKTYKLANHATCCVAGLTADANILIDQARLRSGRFQFQYGEPIPIEQLVEHVCNYKQSYTQYGGLRPFGVAFLFAGYDCEHGYQLYQSDPSGNYSGWKATVIGANNSAGKSLLKNEYDPDGDGTMPDMATALKLAVKVLNKTMDSATVSTSAEKMELFTMTRDRDGDCIHKILTKDEVQKFVDEVAAEAETTSSGDTQ